jgi:hypothetical protein
MKRAAILGALAALLCAAPPALAQGGAAQCRQPVKLSGTQRVSSLTLTKGSYRISVQDTADLTCDEARSAFQDILDEPGGILPKGWQVDAGAQTFSRKDGSDAFSIAVVPAPAAR